MNPASPPLRIGITMREVTASNYPEPRDALAQDWGRFLAIALPEAAWLPIPNLADESIDFCRRWQLNALILSGGEDIGRSPRRDATEHVLLAHALACGWPTLGICRGLQIMWTRQCGQLRQDDRHAGAPHGALQSTRQLNSYHRNLLDENPPVTGTTVLLRAADGSAECVRFDNTNWLGLMWHPEREPLPHPDDIALLRTHFGVAP